VEKAIEKLAEEWGIADKFRKEAAQQAAKQAKQQTEKEMLALMRQGKNADEIERILASSKA